MRYSLSFKKFYSLFKVYDKKNIQVNGSGGRERQLQIRDI